eukprot:gene1963-2409_t
MVLNRPPKLCNFLEWKEYKIIFKRYASLYFVAYYILDELIMAGELQETSKKTVLRLIAQQDAQQENPSENKVDL